LGSLSPPLFDLDVGARLIGIDFQERVADAQGHPIVVRKDDVDMIHADHLCSCCQLRPGAQG